MKNLFTLTLTATILLLTSCSVKNKDIKGDKNLEKREYAMSDYSKVDIGGAKEIVYKQLESEAPSLAIETDANIHEYVEVKVENNTLKIIIEDSNSRASISPSRFVVYTNSKTLEEVDMSGASSFVAETPINASKLSVSTSGASKVVFAQMVKSSSLTTKSSGASKVIMEGDVFTENLELSTSGSANLTIENIVTEKIGGKSSGASSFSAAGKASLATLKTSGAASVKAADLIIGEADLATSGGSNITAQVEKTLVASASGDSQIRYKGSPTVDKSTSGGASINSID